MAHSHFPLETHETEQQETVALWLLGTFLGAALVVNAFIVTYVFQDDSGVADLSALIGAVLLAIPIIVAAVKDLFHGHREMQELVAIAVLASFAMHDYKTAGVVAFIMLLADLVQHRTALGARQAIHHLVHLTPTRARLMKDGQEQEVEAAQLKAGDQVRLRPGDTVPADGEIVNGQSTFDEATITGESLPVDKEQEDQIFAGTHNLTGSIVMKVTRAGEDTTLGRVRDLILEAESTKIPIMRLMDQYVHWYTPVVLMVAGIIFFFTRNIYDAITALVLMCPCAFILAMPTAMVAALSAAARVGILVKDVKDLESAAKMNAIAFDKTGTLTTGRLAVTRLTPATGVEPGELLKLAACLEHHSNHPAARAVVTVAREADIDLVEPAEFGETAGKGVSGRIDSEMIRVGRGTWLRDEGVTLESLNAAELQEVEGISPLYVSKGDRCIGWIGVEDNARPDAKIATQELKELGVRRITMFTGDRWSVAKKVAAELGCTDVEAECLPERKLELVNKLKEAGYTLAVVGDGVNDAPALAAGDIGVAMGAAGSDVAINSATIALMSSDLTRLPFLIRLSRKTRQVVYQNLAFGGIFILVGLLLIGMGTFQVFHRAAPIAAAILHIGGSFVVIFNSARLVRFGENVATYHGGDRH